MVESEKHFNKFVDGWITQATYRNEVRCHFLRVWMGGTNLSCQLKIRRFVSCQLNFRLFVSCQLNGC